MVLIKDNIFENPDKIRNIAINSKYGEPQYNKTSTKYIDGWRGYRHTIINFTDLEELEKIPISISNFYSMEKFSIKYYFHYTLEKTKKTCFPSFEEYKYHRDDSDYAGVVYLSKNPPKNSGTTVINNLNIKKEYDNMWNRLICYPSTYLHAPSDLFGNDINDGRLTLTFFVKK